MAKYFLQHCGLIIYHFNYILLLILDLGWFFICFYSVYIHVYGIDVDCYCRLTDKQTHAMNMGSYNYLGFAQTTGPCADDAEHVTLTQGTGVCSSRHELGNKTCSSII